MNLQDEYVQCLLAAGWIHIEDIDDEYQAYLKTEAGRDETMSYLQWNNAKQELANVLSKYDVIYAELGTEWSSEHSEKLQPLLKEASWLETVLGY